jgi:allantoin racemase
MRIANLMTSGAFWTRLSEQMSAAASARGLGGSVEAYDVGYLGLPGTSDLSMALTDLLFVQGGIRAAQDGCDAVFLNAVPDYGLGLLRATVGVPVVGAGEATIHAAQYHGERFSIVTVWPTSSRPLYDRLLAQTGAAARCASVVYTLADVDMPTGDRSDVKAQLEAGDTTLLERLVRSCRDAIDRDGADSIVLGCTCMHPLADALAERVDRPVLDPVVIGWGAAELAAEAATGAESPIRPGVSPRHVDALASILGGSGFVPGAADVECEVCELVGETAAV